MEASKEQMLAEAKERMLLLGISKQITRDFIEDGVVSLSEGIGYLYWINDEEKEMVSDFESKTGSLVYHIIKTYTDFGLLYSLLFVSKKKDTWKQDKKDIEQDYAFVYVVNKDEEAFSEFGSIAFRRNIGGLVRTS